MIGLGVSKALSVGVNMFASFSWANFGLNEILILSFNLGNLLAVLAFAVRGAITLRALAVIGAAMQALFYFYIADAPIYYGAFWKIVTCVVAMAIILLILRERIGRQFAAEVRPFAQSLRLLNPGQVEKLIRLADKRVHEDERCILRQGEKPEELYYLMTGSASVQKNGVSLTVQAGAFLGEIAFVSGGVATADVLIEPSSHYLAWSVDRLNKLLAKDDQIDIALRGLINHDLARKISAQPIQKIQTESVTQSDV